MKKVITALGNPILNEKIKDEQELMLLSNDIQYQDGIIEIIQKNEDIDYLILSEILPGENDIKKLITKIKNKNKIVKIIIILEEENEELENFLYSKGIYKIYYNNKVEINEIIDLIKNDYCENDKIIKELEDLKNILIKNNIYINTCENVINIKNKENKNEENNISKIVSIIKEYINLYFNKNKKIINNKKIISILGTGGVRQKYCYN